jgi:hypothetical protein
MGLPGGTVTFLFTDIEGSTRLLQRMGPERYGEALAAHRRLLRQAFAAEGGVEVDTQGDAFFVAFPTVSGAAVAARNGHSALAAGPITVRMGLHTGTPVLTDEGYVGIDVHRGARIAALAHGGQVIISAATADLLTDEPLRDLGRHRLKDFDAPAQLYQLGPGEFPPLRTPGAVDLPVHATAFLGRSRELYEAVSAWLDRDPGVLTIVGPGGTGKTRFSVELARVLADQADGGTVFVALAAICRSTPTEAPWPARPNSLLSPPNAGRLSEPGGCGERSRASRNPGRSRGGSGSGPSARTGSCGPTATRSPGPGRTAACCRSPRPPGWTADSTGANPMILSAWPRGRSTYDTASYPADDPARREAQHRRPGRR